MKLGRRESELSLNGHDCAFGEAIVIAFAVVTSSSHSLGRSCLIPGTVVKAMGLEFRWPGFNHSITPYQ